MIRTHLHHMNGRFGGCWCRGFSPGSGFATGARPWLRSSSPLLSKRDTRWRVRSDVNSAEVTRYVDQCVPVKLEKVPMELLILLLEKDGHLVTRQQIIERLWGNDVFVDTEHGINTAIRKIRQALKDDPDQPRFVQTVTGKGYRFVAAVANVENGRSRQTPSFAILCSGLLSSSSGTTDRCVVARGWLHRSVRASTVTIQSVAVLPLDNLSGDQEQDFFADGMTDELITMLAKISSLRVCERENIKAAERNNCSVGQPVRNVA